MRGGVHMENNQVVGLQKYNTCMSKTDQINSEPKPCSKCMGCNCGCQQVDSHLGLDQNKRHVVSCV